MRPAPDLPQPLRPLVDAHTHIDACGATDAAGVHALVERANSVGVERIVTVADDLAAARFAVAAAGWNDAVFAATALHPTRANKLDEAARTELAQLAADPRTVAVGETGLDYYWPGKLEGCATAHEQAEAFRWHIELAKSVNKPLMVHNRDADADLLAVLAQEGAPETVIFHCFSSDAAMARKCLDAGYILSLSGTVTFKNAHDLRAAAVLIPHDQLLVETDAPFLTPHPFRGAPNESYCLPYTVRGLAALRGEPAGELAVAVTETAKRIYRFDQAVC